MSNFREEAEAHWKYTEGIIKILLRLLLELGKFLYVRGMMHGYKHGKEDAEK